MKNITKNWKTSLIGLIALLGLAYNFYKQGGLEVSDFLLLVIGVGFISAKDGDKTHSDRKTIGGDLNTDEEEEPV
jgi:hypothetical protein